MNAHPKCTAISKSGKPCRAYARTGQELCALHGDPEHANMIARRGGAQRGRQLRKRTFTLPAEYLLETVEGRKAIRRWLLEKLLAAKIAAREVFAATALIQSAMQDAEPATTLGEFEVHEAELTVIGSDGIVWDEAVSRAALPAPAEALALAASDTEEPEPTTFLPKVNKRHSDACPIGCEHEQ